MSETAWQLVHTYYDILQEGTASFDAEGLRAILAVDLIFEGPIAGHRVGAEGFIKGVSGFAETMESLNMLEQLHAGDQAAALYEAEMPGGTVRFAEFFQVADSKIKQLRLLYDANQYRTQGGR
ncbi:MAG: nuclear transport factor 2 family protein [Solirubrobacteraceae bacterium]